MTFKKGQSGNPGGRPKGKIKEIAAKAREHAEEVVNELIGIVRDKGAKDSDRISAGKELLDRGLGKSLTISTQIGGPLEDMNEDELRERLEQVKSIRAELAGLRDETAGEPAGEDADGSTVH